MATDIDFDELDKAVNSLMGGVKEPEDDTPKAKTLEVKDTLKPGEDPMYDKLGEVARGIGNETLEGEREKTVVEDFSPDAETDGPAPKLPVEESDDEQKQEQPEKEPETVPDSEQDSEPEQTVAVRPPAARRPTTGSRFMDVVHPALDMKSTTPSTMPVPSRPIMTVSRSEELSTDKSDEGEKQQDEPPVTPFLPDANAKVEKRPLGSTDPEPTTEESEQQSGDAFSYNNGGGQDDVQKLAEPSNVAPELSEEERALQSIESKPVDESLLLDDDAMRHAESGDTGGIHNDEQHGGHKKDLHDKKATTPAIYDIENYHQPLKTAPKKKMGALKITGIVLLVIVLSAAVGAGAVYILFSMGL